MTFLCSLTCQRRQEEGLLGPLVTDKDGEGRRAVDGEGPGEGRGVDGAEPGGEGGRGVDGAGPRRGPRRPSHATPAFRVQVTTTLVTTQSTNTRLNNDTCRTL